MYIKIDANNNDARKMFLEDESEVMGLAYDAVPVYSGKTRLGQQIDIFDSKAFGRTLAIDGMVQNSVNTEFVYNEMMAHMPLDCHPDPRRVLIIGGGSGLTARQVLLYDCISEIVLCDISDEIMTLCKEYFPRYYIESLKSDKVKVVIRDGYDFVGENGGFDAIIVDCCDPIGCADRLYSHSFYERCIDALSSSGIICVQTGSPLFDVGKIEYKDLHDFLRSRPDIMYKDLVFTCPMIVGGFYSFTLISNDKSICFDESRHISSNVLEKMGYYQPRKRQDYFDIPMFIRRGLGGE